MFGPKRGAVAVGPLIAGLAGAGFSSVILGPIIGVSLAAMIGFTVGSTLMQMHMQPSLPNLGGIGTPDSGPGGTLGGDSMSPVAKGEVQDTSSAGACMPVLYGTRKLAGNFIYFNDFESYHHQRYVTTPESHRWVDMVGTDPATAFYLYSEVTNFGVIGAEFVYQGGTYRFNPEPWDDYLAYPDGPAWSDGGWYDPNNRNNPRWILLANTFQTKQTTPESTVQTEDYYTYSATWALAFCRGPIDKLWKIYRFDRPVGLYTEEPVDVNVRSLITIPGEEDDRLKLPAINVRLYWGGGNQAVNAYIESKEGVAPNFKNTCYLYAREKSIGTQTVVPTLGAEMSHWPRAADGSTSYYIIGRLEANPVHCIHDLLTNTDYGLSVPASQINIASFMTAAEYVYNRNRGYSNILNTTRPAMEWIEDIATEARVYLYYENDQYYISAVEDLEDIDPDALETITWHDINAGSLRFSRRAWDDVYDAAMITYVHRNRQYQRSTYKAVNGASRQISDYSRLYAVAYPGVCRAGHASRIAYDLLRRVSYPLAQAAVKVGRQWSHLHVGELVKLSYEPYNFVGIFRVGEIKEDDIDSNVLDITMIQEPVPFRVTTEWDPDADWEEPTQYTFPEFIDYPRVVEAPRWIHPVSPAIAVFAGSTNSQASGFQVHVSTDGGDSYTHMASADYVHSGGFVSGGGYDREYDTIDDVVGITLTRFSTMNILADATRTQMHMYHQLGYNYTQDEWISVGGYSSVGTTTSLLPVIRHVGEGDPKMWEDGDLVFAGNPLFVPISVLQAEATGLTQFLIKVVPVSSFNVGSLDATSAIALTLSNIFGRPLPVSSIGTGATPGLTNYYNAGEDILVSWRGAAHDPAGAGYRVPTLQIPGLTQYVINPEKEVRIFGDASGTTLLRSIPGISLQQYTYTWSDNQTDHGASGGDAFKVSVAQTAGVTPNLQYSIWRDIIVYRN